MNINGLFVATHPDVYEPSDDTFLLARVVGELLEPGDRFLEVGCGTGFVSLVAARAGAQVVAVDRNPQATRLTAKNARQNGLAIDVALSDLLSSLDAPFDIVAFNPPYLPTADDEHVEGPLDWAFDGGPDGNRVVLAFAAQVEQLPARPKALLVIHSSLSDPAPLDAALKDLGYRCTIAARQRLPHEELTVRRYC